MTVGIFYDRLPKGGEDGNGYLYTDHPQWRNYPHELLESLTKQGARAVVLCKDKSYAGDDTFSYYWLPSKDNMGYFERVDEPVRVDGIFDKGYFRQKASFSLVNVPGLAVIGRDKAKQNAMFGDLQPRTVTVTTQAEFMDALDAMPSDMVVAKPTNLNGGRGVVIAPKDELRQTYRVESDNPVIVQQFVDSSKGIEGLSQGVHDLRLYIIDGEAVLASVRTPKQGSLVANTSQGGTIAFFEIDKVPAKPIEVARELDAHMQQFGNRYYSVDFVTDGTTWYVIEINDRPGVPARFQAESIVSFHDKLATCIIKAVDNPLNHV